METIIFLITFFGASFSYGLVAVLNPTWAWKHGFRASKIREPNQAELLMTKVMGVFLILLMIVILVVVVMNLKFL
ncbi:DUF6199 family natural product biosynthesis protein [Paenibacillus elgii]|uniref:DUF6199 family natural product biosynthesis protein n=1 Tax=Paenibacillus elgii TaxID=189691 RepID=UPI000248D6D9|nr:DUF6199 family natural product biosynthesis protein [Paenibacillus elgii]